LGPAPHRKHVDRNKLPGISQVALLPSCSDWARRGFLTSEWRYFITHTPFINHGESVRMLLFKPHKAPEEKHICTHLRESRFRQQVLYFKIN
jgi:hypothetical protein